MGLICYVLYLPVKKLAYYLNTGSLSPPQPPSFLPSRCPATRVPPSFAFLPSATLQDPPFPLSSPPFARKQQQAFLNDSIKGKLLNTFSNVNALYRSFLQFRLSTRSIQRSEWRFLTPLFLLQNFRH